MLTTLLPEGNIGGPRKIKVNTLMSSHLQQTNLSKARETSKNTSHDGTPFIKSPQLYAVSESSDSEAESEHRSKLSLAIAICKAGMPMLTAPARGLHAVNMESVCTQHGGCVESALHLNALLPLISHPR